MNVYYLGPKGSYSEILAQKEFVNQTLIPVESFENVVEKVLNNEDAVGILGIENSTSSSVHTNVDLIFNNDLSIVGEATMNIRLHLIGKKGAKMGEITHVYSHTQALAQCTDFICDKKLTAHSIESTTAAVAFISQKRDVHIAAIASSQSIKSGQEILQKNIANQQNNMTRWVFVSSSSKMENAEADKITVIFTVKHEPGSLVRVLQKLADANGNLTRIESRPVPGADWEYQFWIDVEIPLRTQELFVKILKEETDSYRIVGAYRRGTFYTN